LINGFGHIFLPVIVGILAFQLNAIAFSLDSGYAITNQTMYGGDDNNV